MKQLRLFPVLIPAILLMAAPAFAQIPPAQTAGSEETRIRKEKEYKEAEQKVMAEKNEAAAPEVPAEKKETTAAGGEANRFLVKEIRFLGNRSIPEGEIRPIAQGLVGKEVTLDEIRSVAADIRKYYRSKGFIAAYVYVPSQQMIDGVLKLDILEGRINEVKISGNKWFSSELLKKYASPLRSGEVLKYDDLWRSVHRLNQRTDIQAKAVLEAGATTGTTDVDITVEDKLPIHVATDLGNSGTRSTGMYRWGLSAENNNLTGHSDELSGLVQLGRGADAVGGSYSVPVNHEWGTRFAYAISHVETKIVGGDLRPLNVKGEATTHSFTFTQPLSEKENVQVDGRAGLDIKRVSNELLGVTSGKDELRILNTGLNFDASDPNGRTLSSHEFDLGLGSFLGGSDPVDSGASRAGTGGKFFIYRGSLTRYQKLPQDILFSARGEWQATSYAVPPSEQLQLGGAHSIRGYQEGEYLADTGAFASLDVFFPANFFPEHWRLPNAQEILRKQVQLIGFADVGTGNLKKPLSGELANKYLAGAGAGMRIHLYDNMYGRFEWAFPLGDEPFDHRSSAYYFTVSYEFM